ncbi:MAG: sugar ABC transporter permease [Pseudomonadota bacterium]
MSGALGRARRRSAALFLAPMLALLALVAGWPLARTIYFAFTDARLSEISDHAVIGFDNFWNPDWGGLMEDPAWWQAVGNTLWFAGVSVAIETVLGLVIALALSVRFPMRGLVRAAVLIPWAIPTIVSAKMWGWMLHDQFGVVNWMLMGLGAISAPLAWTADPDLALWSVVMIDVWKTTPFMALLILAALQMLPGDIYEAARIDGVPPWRVFTHVTLPLIWPALMVAVVFRLLDALRMFDLVYALTGNAQDAAMMSVFARQQLVDFQDVGYGSAASTLLFLIIAALIGVILTLGRVRLTDRGA